jgi:hypothetical protein
MLTIFERALSKLGSLLLELFDGTFVDTTTLVDQMSCSCGLARVDVTDDCKELKRLREIR